MSFAAESRCNGTWPTLGQFMSWIASQGLPRPPSRVLMGRIPRRVREPVNQESKELAKELAIRLFWPKRSSCGRSASDLRQCTSHNKYIPRVTCRNACKSTHRNHHNQHQQISQLGFVFHSRTISSSSEMLQRRIAAMQHLLKNSIVLDSSAVLVSKTRCSLSFTQVLVENMDGHSARDSGRLGPWGVSLLWCAEVSMAVSYVELCLDEALKDH